MTEEITTICDRCGAEIPVAEANVADSGDWEGATLCNDCYAEECAPQWGGEEET